MTDFRHQRADESGQLEWELVVAGTDGDLTATVTTWVDGVATVDAHPASEDEAALWASTQPAPTEIPDPVGLVLGVAAALAPLAVLAELESADPAVTAILDALAGVGTALAAALPE